MTRLQNWHPLRRFEVVDPKHAVIVARFHRMTTAMIYAAHHGNAYGRVFYVRRWLWRDALHDG